MLPPGAPPSWSSTGSICRYWYVGPPAAAIAAISVFQVTSAATTGLAVPPGDAVVVLDLLDGDDVRRLEVVDQRVAPARRTWPASRSAARFSTLNDAIASSLLFGDWVTSRCRLPVAVGAVSG